MADELTKEEQAFLRTLAIKTTIEEKIHAEVQRVMNSEENPEAKPFNEYYRKVSRKFEFPPDAPIVDPETTLTQDQKEIFNYILNCYEFVLRDSCLYLHKISIQDERIEAMEEEISKLYEILSKMSKQNVILMMEVEKHTDILNNVRGYPTMQSS